MSDSSDRKRLEAEVHQTDLRESRVNEDFLDGLKQYGPWVITAILAVIAIRLWVTNADTAEASRRATAWVELMTTTEPASLAEIATIHGDIDAVAPLARLKAGRILLGRLSTEELDDTQRTQALDDAARQFELVLAGDDGARATTLVAVSALNGLAAVAESRGDAETARDFYNRSAQRAEGWLEPLATQALARAQTADVASLPTARPAAPTAPTLPGGFQLPPGLEPLGPGDTPPTGPLPPAQTNPLDLPVGDTTEPAPAGEDG
ncbi:MAG: hypothetical protein MK101_04740 [Phycisphaerales bacterium]|nr:hypothetical protein [Phycisphaerales bacterium]